MAEVDSAYTPPAPPIESDRVAVDGYIEGGRVVESERGWGWIRDGYRYFRRQAGMWVVLTLIFFLLVMGINFIPKIGWLVSTLLMPVFVGGLITACRTSAEGGELELSHLFAGFRHSTGQLMLVGLIGFVLTILAMVPISAVKGAGVMSALSGSESLPVFSIGLILAFLISLALFIPVNMAMWFASALVILQDQSAPRAIAESFRGCLKNIVPFLIYGVILFVLAMLAAIPAGLGWLVLAPVVLCSVYAAYLDIYVRGQSAAAVKTADGPQPA